MFQIETREDKSVFLNNENQFYRNSWLSVGVKKELLIFGFLGVGFEFE